MNELVDLPTAAGMLGLTYRSAWERACSGVLGLPVRRGRRIYLERASVERVADRLGAASPIVSSPAERLAAALAAVEGVAPSPVGRE